MEHFWEKITQKNGDLYIRFNFFLKERNSEENIIWDTSLNPIDYPKEIKKYFKLCVENRKKFVKWFGSASSNYKKYLTGG